MADTKISALTAIDAVAAGDEFPANDVSTVVTKKVTAAQIATYVNTTTGAAVSAMTAASALDGAELYYVVQGGNDRKATGDQIQALCVSDTAYASSWNGVTDQAPSKNAVYDAFESLVAHPPAVSTRWYDPAGNQMGGAGAAFGAIDRIYFRLGYISRAITVTDLGCRITTAAAAGKFIQLALYGLNATTGHPTGNPLASTGSIAADSAAAVSADITGANVALSPGWVWMAAISDGTPAVRNSGAQTGTLEMRIGSTTLGNVTGAYVSAPLTLYFGHTFGTWPDMTSNTCTEEQSTRGATVFIKAV